MHYRGMEFGSANVWKTSHPQAMEFFHTQTLDQVHYSYVPRIFPRGVHQVPNWDYFTIFLDLKLHENKIIWTLVGSLWCPLLDPPMLVVIQVFAQENDMTLLKCTNTCTVANNDLHMWLAPAAAFGKPSLNPCHNMAHLMIKY